MKANLFNSLIYVLLAILIICGIAPGMASALDDNPEDTDSSTIADSVNGNSKSQAAEEPEETPTEEDPEETPTEEEPEETPTEEEEPEETPTEEEPEETPTEEEPEETPTEEDPEETPTEEEPEETPTEEEPEETPTEGEEPEETPTEEEPEETPTEEEPEETPTEEPKETPTKEKPVKENPNKGNSDNKKIVKNQSPDIPSIPTPTPSPSPSPDLNLTPDSSSNSGSASDSDSDSESSMGSGVSQEAPSNIEVKELATRHVIGGYHINYEFLENATCITFIEYDAKRTFRKTTAVVEVLKDKSSLVSNLPAGKIYEHVNIWVGEQGGGLPTSIKNAVVGFKVEKAWIKNNNIDEAFITLQWYDKEWQPLYTEKTGEDQDYVYFIASTPGYSSFAITEYTTGETNGADKNSGKIQEVILRNLHGSKQENMLHGNIEKNTADVKPMQAAKVLMAISLPAFLLVVGYCVLKKKI